MTSDALGRLFNLGLKGARCICLAPINVEADATA
jgi:hypothetical protein